MKNLISIVATFLLFFATSSIQAQLPPPTPSDGDYCSCVPGIQDEHYACPPCPPATGNTGNTGNTGSTGNTGNTGPNEGGSGSTGNPNGGVFPNVIAWLECFYDPDCDP